MLIDAAVVDAPPIDTAPTCTAPSKTCGASCIDVSGDEDNCGDCGVVCKGGAACDSTCACPAAFVGASLDAGQFDQFQAAGGLTIAINPNLGSGAINPFIVGYNATVALGTNIDLSKVTLGDAPFVALGYRFSLDTNDVDAAYVATAGTLELTQACSTHVQGTLTNATFKGIDGDFMDPELDPDGCTFDVATVTFSMGAGACP